MRIRDATLALEGFQTRKALQEALFLMKKDIDRYFYRAESEFVSDENRKEVADLLIHVLKVWIRLLSPFTPHTCEEMWHKYGGPGFISEADWPQYDPHDRQY